MLKFIGLITLIVIGVAIWIIRPGSKEDLPTKVERVGREVRETSELVQHSAAIMKVVADGQSPSKADQEWMLKQLKTGGAEAQAKLQPILVKMYENSPQAKEFARKQIEQMAKLAEKEANKGAQSLWKEALRKINEKKS